MPRKQKPRPSGGGIFLVKTAANKMGDSDPHFVQTLLFLSDV